MKAVELRIGSWVIIKPFTEMDGDRIMSQSYPQLCQISGIQKIGDSAIVQVNDNIIAPVPIEYILGVPLNEKMLLMAGFNNAEYKEGYIGIDTTCTDFVLSYPKILGDFQKSFAWEYQCGCVPLFNQIECVHELQNLFLGIAHIDLDFSFLQCADVVLHFEENNSDPIVIAIKIQDK